MYSNRVSSPTCSPSWANQVLTELVSAVSRAIGPKLSVEVVFQRPGPRRRAAGRVDRRFRRDRAAVEPGGRGHHLEGRARRVLALGGAVEQRRFGFVFVQLREFVGDPVGVVGRVRGEHPDPAAARLDRDHGAEAGRFEVAQRDPLRRRVDVGDDVVAFLLRRAARRGSSRIRIRCRPARRCGTARTRCRPGARSCSRSGGRRASPPGSGARSAGRRRAPWRPSGRSRCRRRRGSGRAGSAAARAAAACWRPSPSAPGVEDRPVGREADQDREEDDDRGRRA